MDLFSWLSGQSITLIISFRLRTAFRHELAELHKFVSPRYWPLSGLAIRSVCFDAEKPVLLLQNLVFSLYLLTARLAAVPAVRLYYQTAPLTPLPPSPSCGDQTKIELMLKVKVLILAAPNWPVFVSPPAPGSAGRQAPQLVNILSTSA